MGFFDDPSAISQAEAKKLKRQRYEQQVINDFCSQENLNKIAAIVKDELRSRFIESEGVRRTLYWVTVVGAYQGGSDNSLIISSEACRRAVEQTLQGIDSSLKKVTMEDELEGYGIRLVLEF